MIQIPVNHAGQVQPSFQTYLGRLFIDLSFYVIVSVIGLGVISAILIVRFNQLRTESVRLHDIVTLDVFNVTIG